MEKLNKNGSKIGLDNERKDSPKGLSSGKSGSCGCKYEANRNLSQERSYDERSEKIDQNLSSSEKQHRSKMTDEDYNKDYEND